MAVETVFTTIKVFAGMIVMGGLFTFMFWSSTFMGPPYPSSELRNFSVSNVNTSFPGFTMNWDVKVKVTNPGLLIKAKFTEIKTSVYYENDFLASGNFVEPFSLKAGKSKEIDIKLSAKDTELGKLGKWVVEKIAKEKASKGTVSFRWSMVFATKRSFGLLKRHAVLRLSCDNIRVVLGNTSRGSAISNNCMSIF